MEGLAEGEELASNILRVVDRNREYRRRIAAPAILKKNRRAGSTAEPFDNVASDTTQI